MIRLSTQRLPNGMDLAYKYKIIKAEDIRYTIDLAGSMQSYRILLSRLSTKNYQIVLYNGDWDDVVPYHDTVKAIKELYLTEAYI
jgi:hypothetical protein